MRDLDDVVGEIGMCDDFIDHANVPATWNG